MRKGGGDNAKEVNNSNTLNAPELVIKVFQGLEYVDRLGAKSAAENVAAGRDLLRADQSSTGARTTSVKS